MQLLLFGQEFFAHHRFDSLPMNELAARAGVSKALLYHYFGDRRGYYLATVRFTMDEIINVFETSPRKESASLRELLVGLTDYFSKTRHFYLMSTQSGDGDVRKEIDRVRNLILSNALEIEGVTLNSKIDKITMRGWSAFCESAISDWLTSGAITQTELVDLLLYQMKSSLQMIKKMAPPK